MKETQNRTFETILFFSAHNFLLYDVSITQTRNSPVWVWFLGPHHPSKHSSRSIKSFLLQIHIYTRLKNHRDCFQVRVLRHFLPFPPHFHFLLYTLCMLIWKQIFHLSWVNLEIYEEIYVGMGTLLEGKYRKFNFISCVFFSVKVCMQMKHLKNEKRNIFAWI